MSIDTLDVSSDEKQSMPCPDVDTKEPFPLLALPDTLLLQIMLKLPPAQLYGIVTTCPPLKLHAETALYSHLIVDKRERLDRLMKCHPNPESIAADVKVLEVPGSLTSPAKEYVERLEEYAPHLTSKKVQHRDANISTIPYVTSSRHSRMVRELQVGCYSAERITENDRYIKFSELAAYPNLRRLHWIPVDPRLGSVQTVYRKVHSYCPDLEVLELPWCDRIDDTPWDSLPMFPKLRLLIWHFPHYSRINVNQFIRCLRTFQSRNIKTQVGSGCDREMAIWLSDLYRRIQSSYPDMLNWVLTNNSKHQLKSYKLPAAERDALFRAIRDVDYAPQHQQGLRLDADLTSGPLPDVLLSGKLQFLRLIVNRTNIDRNHIPNILRANPHLRSLVVAKHLVHHGGTYDGNCTYAKVPLLPGQDVVRRIGSISTIPGVELMFRLRRNQSPTSNTKTRLREWRRLDGGKSVAVADRLPDLAVRAVSPGAWDEALLARLDTWEREVKGWFDLCPNLGTIGVILNTDRDKFGNLESYYCACDNLHTTA
jgi:hypothetical protein